jgi:hypothetical protein
MRAWVDTAVHFADPLVSSQMVDPLRRRDNLCEVANPLLIADPGPVFRPWVVDTPPGLLLKQEEVARHGRRRDR